MQTPAQDRTKGPVGFSGTVVESRVVQPRVPDDLVDLVITIICGTVRVHILQRFDKLQDALDAKALVPPHSHCSAWGEAAHLALSHGELQLQTDRVITYNLRADLPPQERDLFGVVG